MEQKANDIKEGGTRLTLLGTMGGSRMTRMRAAPSQVIDVNGRLYLVDCGSGVGRQLALAGYNLKDLKCIFITHHHNDHNLDYGTVLSLAQTEGLKERVKAFGPFPLEVMTREFVEWHEYTEKQSPFPLPSLNELVEAKDIAESGVVLEDDYVKVTCARVAHPPCKNPYAFRFDTRDKSITISGDTVPSPGLIELAKGSDVLVHEVYYQPFMDKLSKRLPQYKGLVEWFPTAHTTVEDAGRVAREAEVETLVLSHFVPGDDPSVTEEVWREGASKFFKGKVIVGRDLLALSTIK